jgi:hypothetical protein
MNIIAILIGIRVLDCCLIEYVRTIRYLRPLQVPELKGPPTLSLASPGGLRFGPENAAGTRH